MDVALPRIPNLVTNRVQQLDVPGRNTLCLTVYRGAPNSGLDWSTIQGAVNHAEGLMNSAYDTATITVQFPIGTGGPWVWDPTITVTKPGIVIMASPGSSFYGTNFTLISNIVVNVVPIMDMFINPVGFTGFRLAPADKSQPALDVTYVGPFMGPPVAVSLTNCFIIDDITFSGGLTAPALIRCNTTGVLISIIRSLVYVTTAGALPVFAGAHAAFDVNGSRFIWSGGPLVRTTPSIPPLVPPPIRQALTIVPGGITLLNSILDGSGTSFPFSGQPASLLDIGADSINVTVENCAVSLGLPDQVNVAVRIDPSVNILTLRLLNTYLFLSGLPGSLVVDGPAKPDVVIVGSFDVDPAGIAAFTPGLTLAPLVSVP